MVSLTFDLKYMQPQLCIQKYVCDRMVELLWENTEKEDERNVAFSKDLHILCSIHSWRKLVGWYIKKNRWLKKLECFVLCSMTFSPFEVCLYFFLFTSQLVESLLWASAKF